MKLLLFGISLIGGFFFIPVSYSQNRVTVTDCNLNGWVKQVVQTNATVTFKNAPPSPLIGKGSLEFSTPQGFVRLRNTQYQHQLLSSFTEFSYSSYIQTRSDDNDAPWIVLQIDLNGDNTSEDVIVFNPEFQTGLFALAAGVSDQGVTQTKVWQNWDALHGVWWLGPTLDPYQGGAVFSIATYISQKPTARIINDGAGGTGGIRLQAGGPAPVFSPNFKGYVDNFKVGTNGATTIYDFEYTTADAGADQNIIYGYGSNCTQLTGTVAGGVGPYSFVWSQGAATPNSITTGICLTTTSTYTLTVTDANGCTRTDDVTVYVTDVRCGTSLDKVKLCHNGTEICVAASAVSTHLSNHGDVLGTCNPETMTQKTNFPVEKKKSDPFFVSIYPNPFSFLTRITYDLPFEARITLKIYDITGCEVAFISDEKRSAGQQSNIFYSGSLGKGVYYFKIIAESPSKNLWQTGKMVVIQ